MHGIGLELREKGFVRVVSKGTAGLKVGEWRRTLYGPNLQTRPHVTHDIDYEM